MSLDETNGGVSLSESNGGGATGDQGAPKRSKKKAKNTKLEPQVTFDENGQPIYPADMSETDKVIYQSMESTKRMVALCEESKGAAINTLVNLDDQGGMLK
ncbi:uncharacterized protein LOC142356596 [Convolutriloba macropyga]|uniref:uncharacterized protein LOC142356596 n=1 Tax=Convolutriloba macropyga TaxID=536237 RepID=UPI003F526B0E